MDKMYTVLGYSDNVLINEYRKKQFDTLILLLQQNIPHELFIRFEKLDYSIKQEFITHPDQASILKCIDFIEKPEIYIEKLIIEIEKILSNRYEELVSRSGLLIDGTNIRISIEDNNPLNSYDAHPDSSGDNTGGKLGWGSQSPEEWKQVYDNTFALLKKIDIGFFEELNLLLPKIVAFGTAEHIHYSASYRECVGTLYMGYTLGTDIPELHVLEGLVHESSHNKLNLIMQYEEITLNDFQEKYYSPYRPDARHIYGVFLGIHALIPTVYILLQGVKKGLISNPGWLEKIAIYHMKNKIGIATMKKFGILSNMGEQVFKDLILVSQKSDPMMKKMLQDFNIPLNQVQKKVKEHFMQVNKDYPHLMY